MKRATRKHRQQPFQKSIQEHLTQPIQEYRKKSQSASSKTT